MKINSKQRQPHKTHIQIDILTSQTRIQQWSRMLRSTARKSRIIYLTTKALTSIKCSQAMDLANRYGHKRATTVMHSLVRRFKSQTSTKFCTLILGPRSKATRRVTETKLRIWFHHKYCTSKTSKRDFSSPIEEKQLSAKREIRLGILTAPAS